MGVELIVHQYFLKIESSALLIEDSVGIGENSDQQVQH